MVTVRYADGKGWYEPRVEARAPIPMDPAAAVLHYAQEIFEGLKAYTMADGGVAMFRPDANAARFARSAQRMAMPAVPTDMFVRSLHELVTIDREWLPQSEDGSLYLRPFAYASEVFLGVRPALEYLYLVIASPVGAYFSGGVKPVSVWVTLEYTRAAPGGTGAAKCGGNYAASLSAQADAIEHGCDQVVFLDAVQRRYVDELGGMNIFFVLDDGTLVTPPLSGTILPGVTRDSVIKLAERAGRAVQERPVAFDEWRDGAASGRIREVFACGTAAVITPIGTVKSPDGEFTMADGGSGDVTMGLRKELVDIQRGRAQDPFGWVHRVL
jgi:branched-chain amino acid aminotransferase